MEEDSKVHLSVVIPCFNGADVIGRQMAALQGQEATFDWEIVVADNGSTDGSGAIAAAYRTESLAVVICDASARRGVNHARNVGVQSSRGDFVVLCDADDLVADGWLAAMGEAFSSGSSLVGGRLIRVNPDQVPVGVRDDGLRNDLNFLPWPQGANCGFSRAVYDELGGFDESYARGGDETDFFWRAQLRGYTLDYVAAAAVHYTEKPGPRQRLRQFYYYGRSHVQLFKAFAASGMPRSSNKRAIHAWLMIVWGLLVGVRSRNRRRIAIQHLGQRCGRIGGSLAFRCWYP